ncbi:MAG: AsmA family protein [Proteobacteria bacterium]|nr:AsmA family protein [Pseudomonadota bacterium]
MKHWKKILSAIVVLAVAVVVAGVAIIKSLDFNEYRGLIAEQVKAATGRDLTINGKLNLELSLIPAVSVEGVTFANTAWGSRKEMATLKKFAAEVELLPLLSGDIRVKRLVLVGLDLLAETDAQGRGNWVLGSADQKTQKAESKSSGLLPVVQKVRIEDLTVTYKDGRSGQKTALHIDTLDLQTDGLGAPMTVGLSGNLNGNALQAKGQLGPLDVLLKGGKPYPITLTLTAPGVSMDVAGTIAEPRKGRGINLKLSVDGKDLAATAKAAGVVLATLPPVTFSLVLTDPEGAYQLAGLDAKIGGSDLKGRVTVKLTGASPSINADLSSALLDLDSLLPKQSGAAKAPAKKDSKRVFPSSALPVDGLKAVDAKIRLKANRIITGGIAVEDLNLNLTLGAGRLEIKPLAAVISSGKVNATIVVDGSRSPVALSVNLDAQKIDFGALLKQLKLTDIATGNVDAKIDLKGQGASVAAIMAGLNGRARIVTEGGKIDSGVLNVVSSDIIAALPFVDSKGDKQIRCGVIDFEFRTGQAKVKSLVFETGGLSMIGTGGINLADETIDIKINPRAKKVSLLQLAMLPVNVGGTLASPSALPDVGGAAIGAVTGAVSTTKDIASGGLSAIGNLVGVGGNKSGASIDETDYCKAALAGQTVVRSKAKPKPASTSTSSTPPPPGQPSGSMIDKIDKKADEIGKGIDGALKGLFGK